MCKVKSDKCKVKENFLTTFGNNFHCFLSKAKKASITFHFTLYTFHFGLPIIASVLGDNFLNGGDGALDH